MQSSGKVVSTGKAAELWAVSRDTILKWIKAGKLSAEKTVGGHHRIRVDASKNSSLSCSIRAENDTRYCWSFNAKNGIISADCLDCIVFKVKAKNCYLLASVRKKDGFKGVYCKRSCDRCEYYRSRTVSHSN
jgi:excisionase family DNA binding protein